MILFLAHAHAADLAPGGITTVGEGIVFGGQLGPSQLVSGLSPALLVAREVGPGPAWTYLGFHTAPTLLWVAGGATGAELAVFDLGFTVGDERIRLGPYGSFGLLAAGAGLRAVITPFDTRRGNLRGLEARLTWYAPRTGAVGLYYVHSRLPRRVDRWDERRGERICDRYVLGLGGVVAASSTARSWDLLAQGVSAAWSGSPALTFACDAGPLAIGGEISPFVAWRTPTLDGGADRTVHHMGSVSLGLWAGGDGLRAGPFVTAGVWALGGGVRLAARLHQGDRAAHGLELRALALAPSAPAGEVWALYDVWWGDRR